MLGIPAGTKLVDWNRIVFQLPVIKDIYGCEISETLYKILDMVKNDRDGGAVITHDLLMDEFERGS